MSAELAAALGALRAVDEAAKDQFNKGALALLREYPNNEPMQAALRYCESVLDDGPLVRN